jgi:modulator of FtsH protease
VAPSKAAPDRQFCAFFPGRAILLQALTILGGIMSVILDKEYTPAYADADQLARHKCLRNTYWLLALAMIPSVLGAMIGVKYNVRIPGGLLGLVLFLGVSYGFMYAIEKTKESSNGIAVLFGFTFFLGVMLTPLLTHTLKMSNGASLIMFAFGGTATVLAVMASIATVSKRDFSSMGKFLWVASIVLILATAVNIVVGMPLMGILISVAAIGVFSAWILYDVQQIVNGGETNYIRATMMLFVDIWVIFSHMLNLLGLVGNRD